MIDGNQWLYAGANPIAYFDPTGLFSVSESASATSIASSLRSLQNNVLTNAGAAAGAAKFASDAGENPYDAFRTTFADGMRDTYVSAIPVVGVIYDGLQLAELGLGMLASYFGSEIIQQIADAAGAGASGISSSTSGPAAAMAAAIGPSGSSSILDVAKAFGKKANDVSIFLKSRNSQAYIGRFLAKAEPRTLHTAPYGELKGGAARTHILGQGTVQANHLNQKTAFEDLLPTGKSIPSNDGLSVPMVGGSGLPGTPHYEFHYTVESFWDLYRAKGPLKDQKPTLGQYDVVLRKALRDAGYSDVDANYLADLAKAQWNGPPLSLSSSTEFTDVRKRSGFPEVHDYV